MRPAAKFGDLIGDHAPSTNVSRCAHTPHLLRVHSGTELGSGVNGQGYVIDDFMQWLQQTPAEYRRPA
jgi:hypothetical protein